jgi:hypothetical protein
LKGAEHLTGPFLNDPGYEVPENTVVVVPHSPNNTGFYEEMLLPLKGESKRDWFTAHFYYCLPLTIGNQYGIAVRSGYSFDAYWPGGEAAAVLTFDKTDDVPHQAVSTHFYNGIITFQNFFALKTPPGINLMTIQPPNMFIPGCVAMTGVVETDQIRRDFTFNLKITVPEYKIRINKGDIVGAFIPIPRYFVDKFELALVSDLFDKEVHLNEVQESRTLGEERSTTDKEKNHMAGRRYFKGIHSDDTRYTDHQKTI